jgi:PPK2 family polyphosphate:nucleotide phosphotransferase
MKQPLVIRQKIRLTDFDPDFCGGLDKEKTRDRTAQLCQRIGDLQQLLHANASHAVLLVLQGMDTSGKDGVSRRVLESVNPAGVETANFKAPSAEELAHDFLWRIHKVVPRYGSIGVFNRSHYEDVLIVRVLGLRPQKEWRPRYDQINAFEKTLTDNRVVLLKFFLHISKQEQAERLRARLVDPRKNWKFSRTDLEMRKRWNDFQKAYEDAINRCSATDAPWHLVPANRKWYRDYVVAQTVVEAMEKLKLKWPRPREDLSKVRIV